MPENTFATPAELNAYSADHKLGRLIQAAQNVLDFWDDPKMEDTPTYARYLEQMRQAIKGAKS